MREKAGRVICYLHNTKDLFAAYADDPSTCRSSEGYLFSLFGGPVDWKATRQSHIEKALGMVADKGVEGLAEGKAGFPGSSKVIYP